MQAVKSYFLSYKVDWERNAGAIVAQNPVPAIVSAGLETIAAAKGPAGLREAVMERSGEQAHMSVQHNRQVSTPTNIVSKITGNSF